MNKARILVMAHGHPDFHLGGGEIAAYNLFKAFQESDLVDKAWFIGRMDRGTGSTGAFSVRRKDEYLWEQSLGNSFLIKAQNSYAVWNDFRQLLRNLKPTKVYAHHYFHLGLEYFRVLKQELPNCELILTLHEFMGICHQQGQMVKAGTLQLCNSSSLDDCNRCLPQFSREDFWLRENFIKSHFHFVDHFVSPSNFLRSRYIEWGIPPSKVTVIENGQADFAKLPPRATNDIPKNVFGFFGQINQFKGADLLLQAISSMKASDRENMLVEFHGANLEHQSPEFKSKIHSLMNPLIDEGCVRWVGPYDSSQLRDRMSGVDWVVIPSIWWENSPMVIQESFVHGRPVICSNIGGMAEKVANGIDGLHFEARNHISLAQVLLRAGTEDMLWNRLYSGITKPITYHQCAERHLELNPIASSEKISNSQ